MRLVIILLPEFTRFPLPRFTDPNYILAVKRATPEISITLPGKEAIKNITLLIISLQLASLAISWS